VGQFLQNPDSRFAVIDRMEFFQVQQFAWLAGIAAVVVSQFGLKSKTMLDSALTGIPLSLAGW